MKRFLHRMVRSFMRISVIVLAAILIFVGFGNSAIAFGNSSNSQPSKGTAQMNRLQEQSRRAVREEPRSRETVQRRAQKGPNEVQGNADLHGMNVPDNSKNATTVRKQVEGALKKVTPGNR